MNTVSVKPIPASVREARSQGPIYSSHLDLLRGAAALIVMFGHLRFMLEDLGRSPVGKVPWDVGWDAAASKNPINMMNPPHQAVIVFFVLSGALVGGSVLRDQKRRAFSWLSYAIKRLSRLLTVLIPALILGALIDLSSRSLLEHGDTSHFGRLNDLQFHLELKTFFGNLLFLQILDRTRLPSFGSNTALWSLSAEFWYYILFPLLIAAIFTRLPKARILFLIGFLVSAMFIWRNPLSHFPIWVMGAVVTLFPLAIPESRQRVAVAAAFVQFGAIALLLWKHPFSNRMLDDYLLGLSVSILVYGILHRRQIRAKTLYAKATEHVAQMSFTLYLFHLPLLTLIALFLVVHYPAALARHSVANLVVAPITYFICYLLYLMFERNTDRIKTFAMKKLTI